MVNIEFLESLLPPDVKVGYNAMGRHYDFAKNGKGIQASEQILTPGTYERTVYTCDCEYCCAAEHAETKTYTITEEEVKFFVQEIVKRLG